MDVWDFRLEISASCTEVSTVTQIYVPKHCRFAVTVLHIGKVHPYIHRKVLLKIKKNLKENLKNLKKNLKFLPLFVKKTAFDVLYHCSFIINTPHTRHYPFYTP